VLTKAGDLLTTLYGLQAADGFVEANPVAASIIDRAGLSGLVLTGLVGTVLVVLVVEWATNVCRRVGAGDGTVSFLYVGGYAPLVLVYSVAALHNATLVLTH
jgi:hypothetical protein